MGAIYYITPDIFSTQFSGLELLRRAKRGGLIQYVTECIRGNERPVGGIKINYLHVVELLRRGFDAKALIMGDYTGNYFGLEVPIIKRENFSDRLGKNDVVVATDFKPYEALQFGECKKVIFVQNWINIRRRLAARDQESSYLDLGYDEVITCSDYVTTKVRELMNIDATTITNGIDHTVFFDRESERKYGTVLCLPRKNKSDLIKIKELALVQLPWLEFVEVDGVSEIEIAKAYRKADLFLATGYPEGFALPPLEAMSSGCAVTGFTGGAGSEFMLHEKTALVAPDGDCSAAANNLVRIATDESLKNNIRSNGLAISRQYSLEHMGKAAADFYQRLM